MNKINDIYKSIRNHTFLLNKVLAFSQKLYIATINSDQEAVFELVDNRDRMILDLYNMQEKICEALEALPAASLTDIVINEIKQWNQELNTINARVEQLDQQIIKYLESSKEKLTKEIATIFKNRQSIGGYNLENVKRK